MESPALECAGEERESIKKRRVVQELIVKAQSSSNMRFNPQSVCKLILLAAWCALNTDSTFVPGRCLCPETQTGVRGRLQELTVYPKNPNCDKVTVIVTLKSTNEPVCLSPDAPMGKQLIRCWNRAKSLDRNVKLCLRRKRRRGLRRLSRQRGRASNFRQ
ncbi:C-X-C motif chemokine 9-like [Syngnathus typhle]|uniref:C-X-C motif chemokine 9-like n=1 Tax=Syngnathus typhle TaxID=161592 RepID=UPI002A69B73D|nr:C-X-C motif chemokine 9-like [Syngnathus typhle]